MIAVRQNTKKSVIEHMFMDENAQTFNFCMCNPPFYTNIQELWESRSPARPEPKNGFTGSPHELITEGGELQFCRKIIEESKIHKNKILIFTTMVGHKFNLKELIIDLKADGIMYTTTEFCQGRVTRWGLAWTYQDYNFSEIFMPRDKSRKKNVPISFTLTQVLEFPKTINKLKGMLRDLQINYKVITKRKNELTFDVVAFSNTWSNQRRKRKIQKRLLEEQFKRSKLNIEKPSDKSPEKKQDSSCENEEQAQISKLNLEKPSSESLENKLDSSCEKEQAKRSKLNLEKPSSESLENKVDSRCKKKEAKRSKLNLEKPSRESLENKVDSRCENEEAKRSKLNLENPYSESLEKKQNSSNKNECTKSPQEVTNDSASISNSLRNNTEAVVHCLMKITNTVRLVNLDMEFLNGSAGKEGLHQIVQYIKNNWK